MKRSKRAIGGVPFRPPYATFRAIWSSRYGKDFRGCRRAYKASRTKAYGYLTGAWGHKDEYRPLTLPELVKLWKAGWES